MSKGYTKIDLSPGADANVQGFQAEEFAEEDVLAPFIDNDEKHKAEGAAPERTPIATQPATPHARGAVPFPTDVEERTHSSDEDVLSGSDTSEDPLTEEAHMRGSTVMAQARSVNPVSALQVGTIDVDGLSVHGGRTVEMQDRLDLLEGQIGKKMRCQACTFAALGFSLGVAITSCVLLFVVLQDSSFIATNEPVSTPLPTTPSPAPTTGPTKQPESPQPTESISPAPSTSPPPSRIPTVATPQPTLSPTTAPSVGPSPLPSSSPVPTSTLSPTTTLEASWIELIQSRSPTTTFDDVTSPQRLALNWMLQDPFTLALNDSNQVIERFALTVIYFSTGGPTSWFGGWENSTSEWLNSTSACDWGGLDDVECNDQNFVTQVDLSNDGLTGSIPIEIGLLTNLEYLDFFLNEEMADTIPTEVGLLSALTYVSLSRINFEGTIPSELGLLTGLVFFDIFKTKIQGTIPTELAALKSLESWNFHGNQLQGSIPTEFGLFPSLVYWSLWKNELTGPIPTEFGLLSTLEEIHLSGNDISGTIPTEVGLMTALSELSLRGNKRLSGIVPTELGQLTNLQTLHLTGTDVLGSIPANLCGNFTEAEVVCVKVECECCNSSTGVSCKDVVGPSLPESACAPPWCSSWWHFATVLCLLALL